MFVLATLCLLVGSSLGAAVGNADGSMAGTGNPMMATDGSNKTICCMPQQWETTMVDLNTNGNLVALRYAHDDVSMREGFYISAVGPGSDKPYMQIFKDFADKKTYTVNMAFANPRDYTCSQTVLKEHFFAGCTHKDDTIHNLRFVGDATVGPAATGLHYDGWAFTLDGGIDVLISLSRDGCVPLMESLKSPPGVFPAINNMFMFNDFVPTIAHKELLTIPAACVTSGAAVVG